MAAENSVTIVGNLADDPDLRYTPNGVAVVNCPVAVNRRYRDPNSGEFEERLDGFFRVTLWRNYAENVAESLSKGDRVIATGRLRNRSYEDRDGNQRTATEIDGDEICPSLRFATASVQKTNRPGGGGGGASAGSQGGAPPSQSEQSSWGGAPPPQAPEPDSVPF